VEQAKLFGVIIKLVLYTLSNASFLFHHDDLIVKSDALGYLNL